MLSRTTSLLLALALTPSLCEAQISPTADFELRFESTWSSSTHPGAFPSGALYSPLIGATHRGFHHLWQPGGFASSGMEQMAETGGFSILTNEINAAINNDTALERLIGPGLGTPSAATISFTATIAHSRVSLVTMIAPSPDWFLGVDGLALIQNGRWIDTLTVDLFAWDAGTDSGTGFTSPNQNSIPQTSIQLITGGPFFGTTPLGTITVTRRSGATYCTPKVNSQGCMPSIYSTGEASMTQTTPFEILANNVLSGQFGLLFYGFSDQMMPFQGGTMCVGAPRTRTAIQNSAGNAGAPNCSGLYTFDMNARIQSGVDSALSSGSRVFAQYWSRDPQASFPTGLTNALDFTIFP